MSVKRKKAVALSPLSGKMPGKGLVRILWVDSTSWSGWQRVRLFISDDIPNDDLHCESVGWIVHEDDQSVALASHRSMNHNIAGIMRIPKCAILRQTKLS